MPEPLRAGPASILGLRWLARVGPSPMDAWVIGKLEWQTGTGWRRATHRPDLVLSVPNGVVVVEVELRRKSSKRLAAVLSLYRSWLADSKIAGVVYVCGSTALAERVERFSADAGIPKHVRRFELLAGVQAQALRVEE